MKAKLGYSIRAITLIKSQEIFMHTNKKEHNFEHGRLKSAFSYDQSLETILLSTCKSCEKTLVSN